MWLFAGTQTFVIEFQKRKWRLPATLFKRGKTAKRNRRMVTMLRDTSANDWCRAPRIEVAPWRNSASGLVLVAGKTQRPFIWRGLFIPSGLFAVVMGADGAQILWCCHYPMRQRVAAFKVEAAGATKLNFSYRTGQTPKVVHLRWLDWYQLQLSSVAQGFPLAAAPANGSSRRPTYGHGGNDMIDLGAGTPADPSGTQGGGAPHATCVVAGYGRAGRQRAFKATLPSLQELKQEGVHIGNA